MEYDKQTFMKWISYWLIQFSLHISVYPITRIIVGEIFQRMELYFLLKILISIILGFPHINFSLYVFDLIS